MNFNSVDLAFLEIATSGHHAIRRMKHAKVMRVAADNVLREHAQTLPGDSLSDYIDTSRRIAKTITIRDRRRVLEQRAVEETFKTARQMKIAERLGLP